MRCVQLVLFFYVLVISYLRLYFDTFSSSFCRSLLYFLKHSLNLQNCINQTFTYLFLIFAFSFSFQFSIQVILRFPLFHLVKRHKYFHFSNFHPISLKVSISFFYECFISPMGNQFLYTATFLWKNFFHKSIGKFIVNIFKMKT